MELNHAFVALRINESARTQSCAISEPVCFSLLLKLSQALRRRLEKRIYIPLPDAEARGQMFLKLLDPVRLLVRHMYLSCIFLICDLQQNCCCNRLNFQWMKVLLKQPKVARLGKSQTDTRGQT